MARIRTRGQLLDRLARQANKSNTDRERDRAFLDEAWAGPVWTPLTNGDFGIGLTRASFPIVAQSQTFDLPENLKSLRSIVINPSPDNGIGTITQVIPELTSDKEVDRLNLTFSGLQNVSAYYQKEGPGMDIDNVEFPQRTRHYPQLQAGQVLRISWITQPKSLANADGTYVDTDPDQDDTITLDVVDEDVEAVLIGWARLMSTTREDQAEYGRAASALNMRMSAFLDSARTSNTASPDWLGRHTAGQGGRSGY